jgi:hypothetical protein
MKVGPVEVMVCAFPRPEVAAAVINAVGETVNPGLLCELRPGRADPTVGTSLVRPVSMRGRPALYRTACEQAGTLTL